MNRMPYTFTLKMESYIAEPYWPELDDVISIQKKSGMNRAKSDVKREEALRGYLKKEGITQEQYAALVLNSQQKWHKDDAGWIVIPRHHLAGCLVQTVGSVPVAIRGKFTKDSFRHYVRLYDFKTDRKEKDGLFDRYVKNDATNQRRRQCSEVINDFTATGTVEISDRFKVEDFRHLLSHALEAQGVGACRKMGYGRGQVQEVSEA